MKVQSGEQKVQPRSEVSASNGLSLCQHLTCRPRWGLMLAVV